MDSIRLLIRMLLSAGGIVLSLYGMGVVVYLLSLRLMTGAFYHDMYYDAVRTVVIGLLALKVGLDDEP